MKMHVAWNHCLVMRVNSDIPSGVSGDQGSSDNNPIATIPDIPSPGSREGRQVRLPMALTDYDLS